MRPMFNSTEQQEREYLKLVRKMISRQLDGTNTSVDEHVRTLREYKEYLWNNKDIDVQEKRSMRESILNLLALGNHSIKGRDRLEKMLHSPYFGRIDFAPASLQNPNTPRNAILPIYIGIHSLYDLEQKKIVVYDWRAPLSGKFFDSVFGVAFYEAPSGRIEVCIAPKGQYHNPKRKLGHMI